MSANDVQVVHAFPNPKDTDQAWPYAVVNKMGRLYMIIRGKDMLSVTDGGRTVVQNALRALPGYSQHGVTPESGGYPIDIRTGAADLAPKTAEEQKYIQYERCFRMTPGI